MSATINTFWWRWKYPHRLNFGDEVTAPLVERITGRPVKWTKLTACDLVGAGSVIEMVINKAGENRPLLWGSGFISAPEGEHNHQALNARAVRGRLSSSRIAVAPGPSLALGDPGLLAPLLLDHPVRKRYTLGFIPHYRDAASPSVGQMRSLGNEVRLIDVGWTPEEVAREVAACDVVISSSLHGLIFSDALGVPNAHVSLGGKLKGGLYKFQDYYSAFDGPHRYQEFRMPSAGPESARAIADTVNRTYVPPPHLARMQDALVNALNGI